MATFEDEQKPINLEIVRALVRCVPREWRSARMDAERKVGPDGVAHHIAIESPEGHDDLVTPSEDLMLGLRRLDLVFQRHGHPWSKVHYTVTQTDDWNWGFESRYEYDD